MEPALVRDPVYQQINGRLKALASRAYRPGDKFLTEREIVARFAVSRPTANKALAGLVSEGVLEFRKGVGTFVRRPVLGTQSLMKSNALTKPDRSRSALR